MEKRNLRILSATPVHPGRGEPSYIRIAVEHTGLKSRPLTQIVIGVDGALELAEELLISANRVRKANG